MRIPQKRDSVILKKVGGAVFFFSAILMSFARELKTEQNEAKKSLRKNSGTPILGRMKLFFDFLNAKFFRLRSHAQYNDYQTISIAAFNSSLKKLL